MIFDYNLVILGMIIIIMIIMTMIRRFFSLFHGVQKVKTDKWDQVDCAICYDEFSICQTISTLKCGHKFCSNCLYNWEDYKKAQALKRNTNPNQTLNTSYLLDDPDDTAIGYGAHHLDNNNDRKNNKNDHHRYRINRSHNKRHVNDDSMDSAENSDDIVCPVCDQ